MSEDLEFGARFTGLEAALRDIGRVEQANQQAARGTQAAAQTTQRAAQTASTSIAGLGAAATTMGQNIGRGVAALGQFGTQLGSLAPAGSTAGAAISQLGGAVGALSGGLGPLGAALGGVTVAVGLLGAGMRAQNAQLDASREAVERLTTSYEDLGRAAQNAMDAAANAARVARGGGTTAEQQGFAQAAQNRQELALRALRGDPAAQAELRRQGLIQSGGEPGMLDRIGAGLSDIASGQRIGTTQLTGTMSPEDVARVESLSRQAGEQALERQGLVGEAIARGGTRDDAPAARRRGGGGRGAGGGENTSDAEAVAARMAADAQAELVKAYRERQEASAALEAWETERWEQEMGRVQALAEAERQANAERIAHQRELADAANESSATFRDSWRGSLDDVIESFREANQALKNAGRSMLTQGDLMRVGLTSVGREIADVIGGTMVGAFESALGAWLDGSKSFVEAAEDMVKGVLKALVIESIVQAVTETARGIADIASYRYDSGALHFAAAAAWAAVGGVAGAVGAGIGAFGGAGADKGGVSSAASVTPSDASQTAQNQAPVNITVMPGGFITRSDVANGIFDALEEAGRTGRRLDPSIMGA